MYNFTASVRNAEGDVLSLTNHSKKWVVASIQGLNPPSAQINETHIVGMDGALSNSVYLNTRNVVLTLMLRGDMEANRQELYNYFRTKDVSRLFYRNKNRDVFIDGYVDTIECDIFQRTEQMQISLICPDPFLKNRQATIVQLTNSQARFEFPFFINRGAPIPFGDYQSGRVTVINTGTNVETPIRIRINVLEPVNMIWIQNVDTGEYIRMTYSFQAGDEITINTNPSSISAVLERNGSRINLFPYLWVESTMLQLHAGDNPFGYMVDAHQGDDYLEIDITYRQKYRGI